MFVEILFLLGSKGSVPTTSTRFVGQNGIVPNQIVSWSRNFHLRWLDSLFLRLLDLTGSLFLLFVDYNLVLDGYLFAL